MIFLFSFELKNNNPSYEMCSIEIIEDVQVHPTADRLEIASVIGYQVVIHKGKFSSGQKVVYIQPDYCLPKDREWASSYITYAPTRIKAIKLRNVWSEGLVISLDVLDEYDLAEVDVGTDVSELLGVTKYETPQPTSECGVARLPYGIPKTDEKRWETIRNKLPLGEEVDVTLKVDGQSWSCYYNIEDDAFGVLGRRLEYPLDTDNDYTAQLDRYNLKEKLTNYCRKHNVSLVLRGEQYGEKIQKSKFNPHCLWPKGLMIFSVYIINERRYAHKGHPHYFKNVCEEMDVPMVPIIEENVPLTHELIKKYSTDSKRVMGNAFEGVVIKGASGSFKVINKFYDSKK